MLCSLLGANSAIIWLLTRYLSEQKLPRRMLHLQNGKKIDSCESAASEDEGSTDSGEDCINGEGIQRILGGLKTSPYVIGDLQITSLGNFQQFEFACSSFLAKTLFEHVYAFHHFFILEAMVMPIHHPPSSCPSFPQNKGHQKIGKCILFT